MGARAALYLRVGATGLTVDQQLRDLKAVADRSGYEIAAVYHDEGIPGSTGANPGPMFDAMLEDATRQRFNMMLWHPDAMS
jgi:DNA invertase Pin-like site-specific DNA recombinase